MVAAGSGTGHPSAKPTRVPVFRQYLGSTKVMHSAAGATSHARQAGVIEVVFTAVVQTPPVHDRAASRVTHRLERILSDAIDASVATLLKMP